MAAGIEFPAALFLTRGSDSLGSDVAAGLNWTRANSQCPAIAAYNAPMRYGRRKLKLITMAGGISVLAALLIAWDLSDHPAGPIALGPGVVYECRSDLGGGGVVHVVSVDLNDPHVRVRVRDGLLTQNAYRLDYVWRWAHEQQMVAATNGNFFSLTEQKTDGRSKMYRLGATAHSNPPVLVEGRVLGHGGFHNLLRFDARNRPSVHRFDPKTRYKDLAELEGSGIATWGLIVDEGKTGPDTDYIFREQGTFERTLLGWDAAAGRLWLFVFERASMQQAIDAMIEVGVTQAIQLDSGGSSCMAINPIGGAGRTVFGGFRPVASMIGIEVLPEASIEQE